MQMQTSLNLNAVHPLFIDQAVQAFEAGDAGRLIFSCGGNRDSELALVADNIPLLQQRGIYEKCLLYAFTRARTNFHHWPLKNIQTLFSNVDKERMRAAGDAIPQDLKMRIYRGIAGGRSRRPRGFSWTFSLEAACWFSTRFNLADPCVLVSEIKNETVLAFTNDRHEQEVICRPTKFQNMKLTLKEIKDGAQRHHQTTHRSFEEKKAELWLKLQGAKPNMATA
jgi:hypothetical protein